MLHRLHHICEQHGLHDANHKSFRNVRYIFKDPDMSAKDKVQLIFLLPHVIGPKAEILPNEYRRPMLTALSYAQLLFIAVSGHRSYTKDELTCIFDRGYVILFGSLTSMHKMAYDKKMQNHELHPRGPPPKRTKRTARYMC